MLNPENEYPRSSAARAGMLDLARLLKVSGQRGRAGCAYQLYLERWPTNHLRPEIERVLEGSGRGPDCRGLSPR